MNEELGINIYTLLHIKLEKEMATRSSILAWRIPWMEEPGVTKSRTTEQLHFHLSLCLPLHLCRANASALLFESHPSM